MKDEVSFTEPRVPMKSNIVHWATEVSFVLSFYLFKRFMINEYGVET